MGYSCYKKECSKLKNKVVNYDCMQIMINSFWYSTSPSLLLMYQRFPAQKAELSIIIVAIITSSSSTINTNNDNNNNNSHNSKIIIIYF